MTDRFAPRGDGRPSDPDGSAVMIFITAAGAAFAAALAFLAALAAPAGGL